MTRGKNRCYVCFKKHHKTWKPDFPEDYPNKMKLCCTCFNYSDRIGRFGLEDLLRYLKVRRKYLGKVRRIFCMVIAKKVNKLITIG